jgi:peptide/nickel transport system substrate-binding protein
LDPKKARWIAVIVVVVVVIAGIGLYFLLPRKSPAANVLKIDQAEMPDSLDPDVTFTTPGWAAVQQEYQGLVNYNGSSYTSFVGVLANNWTNSSNNMHWNFTLRAGAHFSNGDPYNAYVQWFSFYRSLMLEQGPQFILEQNFYTPALNGNAGLYYGSNLTTVQAANTSLVNDLNSWNFDNPTPSEIATMGLANQSFRVINANTIQLNLGFGYLSECLNGSTPYWCPVPYTYLLATISAPNSYAVDPVVVQANGGITEGQTNTFLATNTIGTGQYLLSGFSNVGGGGYTLKPDPNYWGKNASAAAPWNRMIQPANTTVQVIFQDSQAITINDLKTGAVQEASFAYIGPSTVSQLKNTSGVVVDPLPTVYGATGGSWWVYMNQNTFPFNNWSVRAAVAHAINYTQIVDQAFGGYAAQWVGPVPPSYPYYNPANLPPYSYDLALAKSEIANSPCANNACAGTAIPYAYLSPGTDWSDTAQFLVTDLAAIGLTITPVPISLDQLITEQSRNTNGVCTSTTTTNGGPFPMGQEFYTSDYVSPDDWTQNDAVSTGSANMCMSAYANATMDGLVYSAASDSNPANLTADYTQMTSLMYYNYTDAWLCSPTAFAVYTDHVHGFVTNPMGSAEPYVQLFNTEYLS